MPLGTIEHVQALTAWEAATRQGTEHSTSTHTPQYSIKPEHGQRGMALGYLKYLRWSAYAISEQCRNQLGVDFRKEAGDDIEREMMVRQALRDSFAVLVNHAKTQGKFFGDYTMIMNARGFENGSFTTYQGWQNGLKSEAFALVAMRMARTPADAEAWASAAAAARKREEANRRKGKEKKRAPQKRAAPPTHLGTSAPIVWPDSDDEPAPARCGGSGADGRLSSLRAATRSASSRGSASASPRPLLAAAADDAGAACACDATAAEGCCCCDGCDGC